MQSNAAVSKIRGVERLANAKSTWSVWRGAAADVKSSKDKGLEGACTIEARKFRVGHSRAVSASQICRGRTIMPLLLSLENGGFDAVVQTCIATLVCTTSCALTE